MRKIKKLWAGGAACLVPVLRSEVERGRARGLYALRINKIRCKAARDRAFYPSSGRGPGRRPEGTTAGGIACKAFQLLPYFSRSAGLFPPCFSVQLCAGYWGGARYFLFWAAGLPLKKIDFFVFYRFISSNHLIINSFIFCCFSAFQKQKQHGILDNIPCFNLAIASIVFFPDSDIIILARGRKTPNEKSKRSPLRSSLATGRREDRNEKRPTA